MIGCLDQSLGNIGASIISGVDGTLAGAGAGVVGIFNGKMFDAMIIISGITFLP